MSGSEELVQQQIRMAIADHYPAVQCWRNNVGVATFTDKLGNTRPVRYGLMNETEKENENFKSSDLIGIRPVVVSPEMVGSVLGVFFAIETKRVNWTVSMNDEHTRAQRRYIDLVREAGGMAGFAQSVHDMRTILRLG